MLTLLEQLDKGTLWRSPGGIHPPEMKSISNGGPIGKLPLFEEYLLPLPQVGEQAMLNVAIGDEVYKGQCLTRGNGHSYLPVHAPTSGTVVAIEARPSNHASALPVLTLVLKSDGKDAWLPLEQTDPSLLSREDILVRIQQAGIAGMGGAAFPSHIKLAPASEIELVIVNGVECEPYITADDRLMREHADDILAGLEIVNRLLAPKRIVIAIEDNKPAAAEAMNAALHRSKLPAGLARVTQIPTKYPSGGEKQLIQIITGKEVPSGAIPAQLGVLVHNVGTLFAIRDAVEFGKPLIERVVTVTGLSVHKPGNYWTPIGTRVADLLGYCDFQPEPAQKIILGGPMMGYTLPHAEVPLLKGSNCVLTPKSQEIGDIPAEKPCIRCGECAVVCPASLLPQQLFWHAKAEEYDKAESYNLKDCIECGCCSYVCPSDIPLVEYYRVAKAAIRHEAEEKRKAERAKVRFEARIARLEDEKNAREAKAKEAAEKRKANMVGNEKDAIAAALARVQAKKAAQADDGAAGMSAKDPLSQPPPVSQEAPVAKAADTKAGVAAAIARAKAKKAAQNAQSTGDVSSAPEAAALQPGGQALSDDTPASPERSSAVADTNAAPDAKKAAVAAAIARAKAKKAASAAEQASADTLAPVQVQVQVQAPAHVPAQEASITTTDVTTDAEAEADSIVIEDPKKAAIAAAVARAKAKKAAKAVAVGTENTTVTAQQETAQPFYPQRLAEGAEERDGEGELTAVEAKKAAVAAAIAKAKAKKAAQLAGSGGSDKSAANPQNSDSPALDSTASDIPAATSDAPTSATAETDLANTDTVSSAEDSKKARIAAAVAKAKAKKAAREQE